MNAKVKKIIDNSKLMSYEKDVFFYNDKCFCLCGGFCTEAKGCAIQWCCGGSPRSTVEGC
jgi:hypothetical protein